LALLQPIKRNISLPICNVEASAIIAVVAVSTTMLPALTVDTVVPTGIALGLEAIVTNCPATIPDVLANSMVVLPEGVEPDVV
jgi:hypothetical protein